MSDKKKKKKAKDGQLVLRIDKAERDAFLELCEEMDTTAAREIRRFIKEFMASHGKGPTPEPEEAEAGDPAEATVSGEAPGR